MIADRVGSFTLFSKKIEFTLAFSRPHNLRFYEYFELRGCLRYGAVRCDFRSILVSYFCYLFFWFYIWCGVVQCGLKFSQNHNCTISHFCDYICGAVYKMRFEVGIFFKFWAFSTRPKLIFPFVLVQVLNY